MLLLNIIIIFGFIVNVLNRTQRVSERHPAAYLQPNKIKVDKSEIRAAHHSLYGGGIESLINSRPRVAKIVNLMLSEILQIIVKLIINLMKFIFLILLNLLIVEKE